MSHQHTPDLITRLHPKTNDQQLFITHNHPSLLQTDYISHPKLNLDILSLLVLEFPRGLVHHYQDPHYFLTLSMNQIFHLQLSLYPLHHPSLFTHQIHLFYFMFLYPLKPRPY